MVTVQISMVVHFANDLMFYDDHIWFILSLSIVPRVNDYIDISPDKYKHLEEMVSGNKKMRRNYRDWLNEDGKISFDRTLKIGYVLITDTDHIHLYLKKAF